MCDADVAAIWSTTKIFKLQFGLIYCRRCFAEQWSFIYGSTEPVASSVSFFSLLWANGDYWSMVGWRVRYLKHLLRVFLSFFFFFVDTRLMDRLTWHFTRGDIDLKISKGSSFSCSFNTGDTASLHGWNWKWKSGPLVETFISWTKVNGLASAHRQRCRALLKNHNCLRCCVTVLARRFQQLRGIRLSTRRLHLSWLSYNAVTFWASR